MDQVYSHEGGIFDVRTARASSETDWVTDRKAYTVIVDDKSPEISIDTSQIFCINICMNKGEKNTEQANYI